MAGEMEMRKRDSGIRRCFHEISGASDHAAAIPLDATLDATRMAALIDGLFVTRNPYVTPAGLPVLIRYSLDEIRRRFGLKGDVAEE